MIKIGVLPFNPFQENTIVVSDETGECIIVDAGNYNAQENAALSKYISDNGLKRLWPSIRTGHVDHMLGVNHVKETYHIPFAIHGKDKFLIESAPTHGAIYGFQVDKVPTVDIDLEGQKELKFGNTTFRIIETPGHTPGHIALYNPENKLLLTGDTLFRESIGRDRPAGRRLQLDHAQHPRQTDSAGGRGTLLPRTRHGKHHRARNALQPVRHRSAQQRDQLQVKPCE